MTQASSCLCPWGGGHITLRMNPGSSLQPTDPQAWGSVSLTLPHRTPATPHHMTFQAEPSAIVIEQRFGEQDEAGLFLPLEGAPPGSPRPRQGWEVPEASPPGSSVYHSPCGFVETIFFSGHWLILLSAPVGGTQATLRAQLSLWGQGGGHVSSGQTCGGLLMSVAEWLV